MKKMFSILIVFFVINELCSQITLIPDAAFEQFLINEGIDTDGVLNGQVFTADIEDEVALVLDNGINIFEFVSDLTGIEDFTNLESLNIRQMPISSLDISQNLNLTDLELDDMSLNSLDISQNLNLERLGLSLNSPSDMFSGDISEINMSTNVLLERAIISDSFEEINLSNNPNLNWLELNFSDDLLYVNINNSNNLNIAFLDIRGNPNLECVQVDDPVAVIAGTDPPYDNWMIEDNPTITDDCQLGVESYLRSQIKLYPNPVANKLYIQASDRVDVEAIRFYDLMGKKMLEAKGPSELDVSQLYKGVYLVSITTNKGSLTQKLIKE